MNSTVMCIAALAGFPVAGLAAWAWFAMARVERDLRSFDGFVGLHFEA